MHRKSANILGIFGATVSCLHRNYSRYVLSNAHNRSIESEHLLTTISDSSLCFPCSFNLWWSLSIISDGLFTSVTIFHHFITILFLYVLLCTTFNSFVFPLVTVVRERLQISAKRSSKWMAIFKYVLEHYKQIITLLYTKGILQYQENSHRVLDLYVLVSTSDLEPFNGSSVLVLWRFVSWTCSSNIIMKAFNSGCVW